MIKVVLTDSEALQGTDYTVLKQHLAANGIEFHPANCKNDAEVLEHCANADAIINVFTKLHEGIIDQLECCKVIVRYGIGYDAIDIAAASKRGIAVCNIPDYCVEEVATHTLALILTLVRKVSLYDNAVRSGSWNCNFGYPVHRPNALTLALLGFGRIARQAALYANVFGFTVIAYDPYVAAEVFEAQGVRKVGLDEALEQADILSIHLPLNKDTKQLINRETLNKMKSTAMIVNTGRGAIINQKDLVEALQNKRLLAAGLDVLETEPLVDHNDPIFRLDNVVITPHAAYNSVEASEEVQRKIASTIVSVLNGQLPANSLNKDLLSAG